jgi:hypothetical protein
VPRSVGYQISSFLSTLLPTKYMKCDVKVAVPNLMFDLKRTPKVCGSYSIHLSCSPISTD